MTDDVEFGHVVDLTLGEPSGTELVADAAIGATTLTVDYAGDFEDAGEVVLNGTTLAYTSIAYGSAEADPDVITLAAPLVAAAVVDDKVVRVSGGEPLSDWLLHVSLGDGHPVDIPIPFEQRALWSSVDTSTPVPVMVSADLERLVEVPGRTPVVDGAFIDPTSTIPGGQAFSLDAPTATDGYPEDYGWWQVDATGNVLGFWRLVGGVWTAQTIVTVEALEAGNILADAINVTDLTGVNINGTTITGPLIRTSATGNRIEVTNSDEVRFYSGHASEIQPGQLRADQSVTSGYGAVVIKGPSFNPDPGTAIVELRSSDALSGGTSLMSTAGRHLFFRQDGSPILTYGSTSNTWSLGTGTAMGSGSVGTGTFRDSVRSAVMGDYAAGVWAAYTPTFTAATTNPTLGSFTRVGRYTQRGKTVTFTVVITATAGTGLGSGTYEFGLPVAARNADEVVVMGAQTGPNHSYLGRSSGGSSSVITLMLTSTDAAINATNSGMASGTVLRISGTYEAA